MSDAERREPLPLARAALAHWDLPESCGLDLLKERENTVVAVCTPAGDDLVLRLHRPGYRTDDELRSEQHFTEALRTQGVVATAACVRTADGDVVAHVEGAPGSDVLQATMLRRVPGVPLGDVTDLGALGADAAAQYSSLGEIMARLHTHAEQWSPPEGFTRPSWDIDGLLGEQPLWGRFWDAPSLAPEDAEVLAAFRRHAVDALAAIGQPPARFGLLHGDFLPENILVHADTLTLIDFDDCGWGWHLFDIATSFVGVWGHREQTALEAAFLDGYRSVRDLDDEHLAHLDLFRALRAATYAGWVHSRDNQWARDMRELVVGAAVALATEQLDQS